MIQLVIALGLDTLLGDPPDWPHPIRLVGWVIKTYERLIRKVFKNLYVGGLVLVFMTVLTFIVPIVIIQMIAHPLFLFLFQCYLLYAFLATRCLALEGNRVKKIIDSGDIEASRHSLSYLVGRETSTLNEHQIIKGVIETVSENTIDGTIAPLFYMLIGILIKQPLLPITLYKVVNTLDSMVGYIQPPYKEIGFFSAKLDDVLNYLPARLGAMIMLVSGGLKGFDLKKGFVICLRDRRNHKSPNCAYPESVIAGLLNIQLGGSNTYFGQVLEKPTIGDAIRPVRSEDIEATVAILWYSQWLMAVLGILIIYYFVR